MQRITRIDYVVSPLFDLETDLNNETARLVDNLIKLSSEKGPNPENLWILGDDGLDPYDSSDVSKHTGLILEYHVQSARIIKHFIENCRNFFIGYVENHGVYDPDLMLPMGRFDRYLRSKDLVIDAENLMIYGHGVYTDAGIPEVLKGFTRQIKKVHGTKITCHICKETSIAFK